MASVEEDPPFELSDDILRILEPFDSDFPEELPLPPLADGVAESFLSGDGNMTWDLVDRPVVGEGSEDQVQMEMTNFESQLIIHPTGVDSVQQGIGDPVGEPPPIWLMLDHSPDCSTCVVLREVVHGNELGTMKLSIHGGLGIFDHVIVDVLNSEQGLMQRYFSDLSGRSAGTVKQFLKEYGQLQHQEGLTVIRNSIGEFYDALCVEMNVESNNSGCELSIRPISSNSGLCQSRPQELEAQMPQFPKTGIAAQRERSGKLKLEDIAGCFHLPIAVASEQLKLCTTALKRVCRKHGVLRWPYRKVKSANMMIARLQRSLTSQTGETAVRTQAEIEKIREERDRACEGWSGQMKRTEREIGVLQKNLKTQTGEEAARTSAEITKLKEETNRVREHRKSKKGKGWVGG